MLSYSILRTLLSSILLAAFAATVAASTTLNCADETLSPPARTAACDVALRAQIDPVERATLLIQRARSYKQQFKISAVSFALADLAEADRLLPGMSPQMRADILVERADIYRLSRNSDAAFAALDEAKSLAPGNPDTALTRALLLYDQGDEAGGSQQLAEALKLEPNHPRTLFHAMRQSEFIGEIPACIEYGARGLKALPGDTRILGMRARCMARVGRVKDVEADVRKIEEVGPWAAVVLDDIALAFLVLDRPAEAAVAARRAIQMDPTFQDAYFDLITALMATGAYEESFSTFRAFQGAGFDDRIGLANNLSWELYLAGRYADALQIINEWLASHPEPIDQRNHIANAESYPVVVDTAAHVLAALGRSEEAVAAFLRAAKMSPLEFRPRYEERLAALGYYPKNGEAGFETALRACVATAKSCRLYAADRRR